MTRRSPMLVVGLLLVAGCGAADDAVRAGDDVARWVGLTTDEVDILAQRSAGRVDAAPEELLERWQGTLSSGRNAYQMVPEDARSVACDVAGAALEAIIAGRDDFNVLVSGAEALSSLNQTAGARQLAVELEAALDDWQAGDRGALTWLLMKSSTCEVVP